MNIFFFLPMGELEHQNQFSIGISRRTEFITESIATKCFLITCGEGRDKYVLKLFKTLLCC